MNGMENVVYASVPSLVESIFLDALEYKNDANQMLPCTTVYLDLRVLFEKHGNPLQMMCIARRGCPSLEEFKLQVTWKCRNCKVSDSEDESDSDSDDKIDPKDESGSEDESKDFGIEDVKHWLEISDMREG